jgi:hypothetical protein
VGDEIVQEYGTQSAPLVKISGNYMAYRGAPIRFGKLIMTDTDLILIDLDPRDPSISISLAIATNSPLGTLRLHSATACAAIFAITTN